MSLYAILYKTVESGRVVHKRALVEAETKEAACESLEALAPGGAVRISDADEVFVGNPDFVITRNR